ncbi:serine/threonine protein kinase [Microcoleus sp. ZQ-A2]|nr:serine/threonine protein kinase [Microcoleus sp. FACHB-1]
MTDLILGQRYEVQQQLGKQPGRQTLLARDLQTEELIVIKLLSLGNDFEWQHLKLFEREAETLKSLSHPAIPRYLDYLEVDSPNNKGFALVQSYVEGKTLEQHLKAGRTFSEAEVKELATALLKILNYLHEHEPPVIHRDIKPSNILLTNRSGNSVGQVYLVDFGSVQTIAAQEGGTITVVGTYGYMPPEQFGGRATPASDLYSLGATLIYLITGLHPTEIPQKDGRIQFQQVANLEATFRDWLELMTEPSLDRRLTSAKEALQALRNPRIRNKNLARIVRKPPDSEVILTKTADFLEILLPAKGFGFGHVAVLSLVTPLLVFWGQSLWVGLTYDPISFLLVVGGLLPLFIGWIFYDLFVPSRFRIERKKITLFKDLLGFKLQRSYPLARQDSYQIESTQEYLITNLKGENVWLSTRLTIRVGERSYELARKGQLTEEEIKWLNDELIEWLRLPRTKNNAI